MLYNGNAGNSGFGLLLRDAGGGTTWHTLLGGVNFGNTGVAPVVGSYQHVAAVRDNGTLQLFINGTQIGNTFTNTPNAPAGSVSFGRLDGLMDEVRVFEFAAGQFDPATDLLFINQNLQSLLPIPEPSSGGTLCLAGWLLISNRRCRRAQSARGISTK